MKDPIPFGRYWLLDRLDVGGMAEVFLARDPAGRLVALKRLLPTLADEGEFVDLFLEEARLGAALDHPAIVRVLDAGREGAGWFLAMEWVPGRDLFELEARLAERGELLAPGQAAYVAREVCLALHHAHRRRGADGLPLGLVHRDVSPQNVLLSWDGAVKLGDFGIAASGSVLRGEPRTLQGKPGYMSPEHVRGQPLDARSDVFAAGTLLHEMLTGRRLFDGASDLAVMQKVAAADVPPPSRANPAVCRHLEGAVLRALARDAEARTPSAADLARDLEADADPDGARSMARLLAELFPEERRRDEARAAG